MASGAFEATADGMVPRPQSLAILKSLPSLPELLPVSARAAWHESKLVKDAVGGVFVVAGVHEMPGLQEDFAILIVVNADKKSVVRAAPVSVVKQVVSAVVEDMAAGAVDGCWWRDEAGGGAGSSHTYSAAPTSRRSPARRPRCPLGPGSIFCQDPAAPWPIE